VCCILADCPDADLDSFNPETDCPITDECVDYCAGVVTPGCDCFGCCTICGADGVCHDVVTNPGIAPDCDIDVLDDPALCPACTPAADCGSPCDPEQCILCPGQTYDDLPDTCFEDGGGGDPPEPVTQCPDGRPPCIDSSECEQGEYCSVGCCILDSPF
jgi:hypothetical protein